MAWCPLYSTGTASVLSLIFSASVVCLRMCNLWLLMALSICRSKFPLISFLSVTSWRHSVPYSTPHTQRHFQLNYEYISFRWPGVTAEWRGMVWSEGVAHQNSVLWFAAPGVLLDGSHKLNGLLVQHLPDVLWKVQETKGLKSRANYIM